MYIHHFPGSMSYDVLENLRYLETALFKEASTHNETTAERTTISDVASDTSRAVLDSSVKTVNRRMADTENRIKSIQTTLSVVTTQMLSGGLGGGVDIDGLRRELGASTFDRLVQPAPRQGEKEYNAEVERALDAFKNVHTFAYDVTHYVLMQNPFGLGLLNTVNTTEEYDVGKQQSVTSFVSLRIIPPVAFECNGVGVLPEITSYHVLFKQVSDASATSTTPEELSNAATLGTIATPGARTTLRLYVQGSPASNATRTSRGVDHVSLDGTTSLLFGRSYDVVLAVDKRDVSTFSGVVRITLGAEKGDVEYSAPDIIDVSSVQYTSTSAANDDGDIRVVCAVPTGVSKWYISNASNDAGTQFKFPPLTGVSITEAIVEVVEISGSRDFTGYRSTLETNEHTVASSLIQNTLGNQEGSAGTLSLSLQSVMSTGVVKYGGKYEISVRLKNSQGRTQSSYGASQTLDLTVTFPSSYDLSDSTGILSVTRPTSALKTGKSLSSGNTTSDIITGLYLLNESPVFTLDPFNIYVVTDALDTDVRGTWTTNQSNEINQVKALADHYVTIECRVVCGTFVVGQTSALVGSVTSQRQGNFISSGETKEITPSSSDAQTSLLSVNLSCRNADAYENDITAYRRGYYNKLVVTANITLNGSLKSNYSAISAFKDQLASNSYRLLFETRVKRRDTTTVIHTLPTTPLRLFSFEPLTLTSDSGTRSTDAAQVGAPRFGTNNFVLDEKLPTYVQDEKSATSFLNTIVQYVNGYPVMNTVIPFTCSASGFNEMFIPTDGTVYTSAFGRLSGGSFVRASHLPVQSFAHDQGGVVFFRDEHGDGVEVTKSAVDTACYGTVRSASVSDGTSLISERPGGLIPIDEAYRIAGNQEKTAIEESSFLTDAYSKRYSGCTSNTLSHGLQVQGGAVSKLLARPLRISIDDFGAGNGESIAQPFGTPSQTQTNATFIPSFLPQVEVSAKNLNGTRTQVFDVSGSGNTALRVDEKSKLLLRLLRGTGGVVRTNASEWGLIVESKANIFQTLETIRMETQTTGPQTSQVAATPAPLSVTLFDHDEPLQNHEHSLILSNGRWVTGSHAYTSDLKTLTQSGAESMSTLLFGEKEYTSTSRFGAAGYAEINSALTQARNKMKRVTGITGTRTERSITYVFRNVMPDQDTQYVRLYTNTSKQAGYDTGFSTGFSRSNTDQNNVRMLGCFVNINEKDPEKFYLSQLFDLSQSTDQRVVETATITDNSLNPVYAEPGIDFGTYLLTGSANNPPPAFVTERLREETVSGTVRRTGLRGTSVERGPSATTLYAGQEWLLNNVIEIPMVKQQDGQADRTLPVGSTDLVVQITLEDTDAVREVGQLFARPGAILKNVAKDIVS